MHELLFWKNIKFTRHVERCLMMQRISIPTNFLRMYSAVNIRSSLLCDRMGVRLCWNILYCVNSLSKVQYFPFEQRAPSKVLVKKMYFLCTVKGFGYWIKFTKEKKTKERLIHVIAFFDQNANDKSKISHIQQKSNDKGDFPLKNFRFSKNIVFFSLKNLLVCFPI